MKYTRDIFVKLQESNIQRDQGRHIFSLLHLFSANGYNVSLLDNIPEEETSNYAKTISQLENLTLVNSPPDNPENFSFMYDTKERVLCSKPWQRQIHVKFDIFSPYWFEDPMIVPFSVHPVHMIRNFQNNLNEYRSMEKKIRVFFSGDTKGYVKNWVKYPKEKLPRLEVVNTISNNLKEQTQIVNDLDFFDNMQKMPYTNSCVMVDTGKIWVDDRYWLGNLAKANFFLSPPGYTMPMCHNIIEAMAVGTIPITNYPEWLDPRLEHMKNCIVFDDQNDLIEKISMALNMEDSRMEQMQKEAIDFYDLHLKPSEFIKRIEQREDERLTLLIIAKGYIAEKYKNLGKHSILIRGTKPEFRNNPGFPWGLIEKFKKNRPNDKMT